MMTDSPLKKVYLGQKHVCTTTMMTASPLKKVYLGQKHVWGSSVSFLSFTAPPYLHSALILYYTVHGHVKEALISF